MKKIFTCHNLVPSRDHFVYVSGEDFNPLKAEMASEIQNAKEGIESDLGNEVNANEAMKKAISAIDGRMKAQIAWAEDQYPDKDLAVAEKAYKQGFINTMKHDAQKAIADIVAQKATYEEKAKFVQLSSEVELERTSGLQEKANAFMSGELPSVSTDIYTAGNVDSAAADLSSLKTWYDQANGHYNKYLALQKKTNKASTIAERLNDPSYTIKTNKEHVDLMVRELSARVNKAATSYNIKLAAFNGNLPTRIQEEKTNIDTYKQESGRYQQAYGAKEKIGGEKVDAQDLENKFQRYKDQPEFVKKLENFLSKVSTYKNLPNAAGGAGVA